MLNNRHAQSGVTLVELMIATLIALIALAAIVTSYATTAHHTSDQLTRAHLRQQAQGALHLITRDIRRAGYWRFDPRQQRLGDNPFQDPVNVLRTGAYPDEADASCVLFAYDLDRDGQVGVGRCDDGCPPGTDDDNVEQLGYRLREGRLQVRYGGERFTCADGYWQSVTDPAVDVTELSFTLHRHCVNLAASGQPCANEASRLVARAVEITLSTQLQGREQSRLQLDQLVRVRNDRLQETRHD